MRHQATSAGNLAKKRFRLVYSKWLYNSKIRAEVLALLKEARKAALRERDELIEAIQTGQYEN